MIFRSAKTDRRFGTQRTRRQKRRQKRGTKQDSSELIRDWRSSLLPASNLSEDRLRFDPIIGTRVRFVQRKNEEMAKAGKKRTDKKTGKQYDYTDLVIDQVYELPSNDATPAPAAKATKQAPAKAGKP